MSSDDGQDGGRSTLEAVALAGGWAFLAVAAVLYALAIPAAPGTVAPAATLPVVGVMLATTDRRGRRAAIVRGVAVAVTVAVAFVTYMMGSFVGATLFGDPPPDEQVTLAHRLVYGSAALTVAAGVAGAVPAVRGILAFHRGQTDAPTPPPDP